MFRIIDGYQFYISAGPEKLTTLLKNEQEECVRTIANSTLVADIYDLMQLNESEYVFKMNEKFSKLYGVEIADMMITDITIPDEIAVRLENETTFGVNERFQKKKQEFDLLKTKHIQEIANKTMQYDNERKKYVEHEISKRKLIQKEVDELRARIQQQMSEINSDAIKIVTLINEEAKEFSQKMDVQKQSILLEIRAQANAKVEKMKAEALSYQNKVRSETEYEVAQLRAKALKLLADAEEKSVKKLAIKRDYERQKKEIETLQSLSQNKTLLIKGSTNGNLVAEVKGSKLENQIYNQEKN